MAALCRVRCAVVESTGSHCLRVQGLCGVHGPEHPLQLLNYLVEVWARHRVLLPRAHHQLAPPGAREGDLAATHNPAAPRTAATATAAAAAPPAPAPALVPVTSSPAAATVVVAEDSLLAPALALPALPPSSPPAPLPDVSSPLPGALSSSSGRSGRRPFSMTPYMMVCSRMSA
eukprot:CAMPEP_0181354340 /NCGR_PEP_ID=MMETSP1106-20121128/3308_1 /TAXON_ID=81844 /ORGANISM="Mantoniella antarctica, Strain SL-175" /LENGTH=173 /DNA_ID=CAMNT_0023466995 /DNA_START=246 /DNA_END=768 /DNA_ORIENTATION=-